MNRASHNKIGRLLDVVSDNHEMNDEDIKKDLISSGIDISSFLGKVKTTVRHGMQNKIKEQVATKQKAKSVKANCMLKEIVLWSKEQCLQFLDELKDGQTGSQSQQQIAFNFRNKQDQEFSEDELRSCIKDILSLEDDDGK